MCYPFASLESKWNHSSAPVCGLWSLLIDSRATSVCVQTFEMDLWFCCFHREGFRVFPIMLSPQCFLTSPCAFSLLQVMVTFVNIPLFTDITSLQSFVAGIQFKSTNYPPSWLVLNFQLSWWSFCLITEIVKMWTQHGKRCKLNYYISMYKCRVFAFLLCRHVSWKFLHTMRFLPIIFCWNDM